jgi:EAL domain-containing protein (putative c-di-GMP-specific phosphodiesterase class I)
MTTACHGCRDGAGFDTPFSMAFQPIVDIANQQIFAHEALVRGPNGEAAFHILNQISDETRYAFDQQCRVKAIELATALNMPAGGARLSINFMPNAVYEPKACIKLTLATALKSSFPIDKIIFEFTENERVDTDHLLNILQTYRAMGFKTAIDDFGAGYAGLNLLAKFQPDIIKLDMDLIRDIDRDKVKQQMVRALHNLLSDMNIQMICEGVETEAELAALRDIGVTFIQGYVLARPAFEKLVTRSEWGA